MRFIAVSMMMLANTAIAIIKILARFNRGAKRKRTATCLAGL
jgi:hypothetical protein